MPDPGAAKAKLKLLYLSCGNKDGLINISQGVHAYLKERGVPHIWNVDDEGHTPKTWASNLYHFAQGGFSADPGARRKRAVRERAARSEIAWQEAFGRGRRHSKAQRFTGTPERVLTTNPLSQSTCNRVTI